MFLRPSFIRVHLCPTDIQRACRRVVYIYYIRYSKRFDLKTTLILHTRYWYTIRRESTREERAESSREKNARHEPHLVGRGGKSLLCDPGSELRLGGRQNRRAKIVNGMEKKKQVNKLTNCCNDSSLLQQCRYSSSGGGDQYCYTRINSLFYEHILFIGLGPGPVCTGSTTNCTG